MASAFPREQGYSGIAQLFACSPSLAFFHTFKDLNAEILLDLQGEILGLQQDYKVYKHDEKKASECPEAERLTASIEHMSKADEQSCPYHAHIWRMKLQIRTKLREYNEACLQFEHLMSLRTPNKQELRSLRDWLDVQDRGGQGYGFLKGIERRTWAEKAEGDLACLGVQNEDADLFSMWLEGWLLDWWHLIFGKTRPSLHFTVETVSPKSLQGPLQYYPDSSLLRIICTVNTIAASLLPTVPVFVLYYISNQVARMGAIAVMNLIFSALVTVMTGAKRSDVFAAVTAFTAVQVVFLSNTTVI